MIALAITVNIDDKPWDDLPDPFAELPILSRIAGIPGGMQSGLPAVALAFQTEDGAWHSVQAPLRQLLLACATIKTGLEVRGLLDPVAWESDYVDLGPAS